MEAYLLGLVYEYGLQDIGGIAQIPLQNLGGHLAPPQLREHTSQSASHAR